MISISIAPLLWKYALATGIFAVSNIFAYYYLSLDKYVPVVLSGLFGMLQVFCIVFYHDSLDGSCSCTNCSNGFIINNAINFFLPIKSKRKKKHRHLNIKTI